MLHIFSLCMKKLNVNQILHDDTNVVSNVKNYDKLGNIFFYFHGLLLLQNVSFQTL
jgi:hypothetical protein